MQSEISVYPWGTRQPYNSYAAFIRQKFKERVQKISVNTGFSCPNKDGLKGLGGCSYCNNNSFRPSYCEPDKSVTEQIREGIQYFHRKYRSQKYFAYFQTNSNTYADLDVLKRIYQEAISVPDVVGLVIATRPDCISEQILDLLTDLSKTTHITVEYGVETPNDKTLLLVNRGHTYEESRMAIEMTAARGISTGIHLIFGLPGESNDEIINHAEMISTLPVDTLKIHQLQIIKGTRMAKLFRENPQDFTTYTVASYIELVIHFLEILNPDILIERFTSEAPAELLISPNWNGMKNHEISKRISETMIKNNTRQGIYFRPADPAGDQIACGKEKSR